MVNGKDLASRPGKVAPAKLLLAKDFKPLKKRDRSVEFIECRVSQLDSISQDEIVADQCVEPFRDLCMDCLITLLTTIVPREYLSATEKVWESEK